MSFSASRARGGFEITAKNSLDSTLEGAAESRFVCFVPQLTFRELLPINNHTMPQKCKCPKKYNLNMKSFRYDTCVLLFSKYIIKLKSRGLPLELVKQQQKSGTSLQF